jgi:hypothetical protein
VSHWSDFDEREERESRLASPQEAVAEWAYNAGSESPEKPWLLHDWDVWVANPHYAGPPAPHPESWEGPYEDEGAEAPGFDDPSRADEFKSGGPAEMDWPDDIPF